MKCGFCSYEFDVVQAATACASCPIARGCRLVRCPRCDYEMPPEAKLVGWLLGLRRWVRSHAGERKGRVMESRSDDANLLARVRRRFTWNGHGGATGQPDKTMTVGVGRPGLGRVLPLSALQLGQGGQIGYIQTSRPQHIQKLVAMGVFPGADVTLLRRFPSYVFEVGYSQFAVDEGIAATIYVCLRPSL